jgi:cellulose biosynthesis protein BcsQ
MKILCVTSGKGGVGKTTLSLNLAKQLSLDGYRTVLIDLDIHNKGATSLFLDIVERKANETDGLSFAGLIAATNRGSSETLHPLRCALEADKLTFIPATLPKEMVEWSALQSKTNEQLISIVLRLLSSEEVEHHTDIIVLDCYGGIDSLTVAACGVADDTIIVNEADLITFSGTLLLYSYLANVYRDSPKKPHIHFVINRITSRHSFDFLDSEYRINLAPLAIDDRILAYLPYDRLVLETFGDYPFFSELLPKSLITQKIRLILWRLYSEPKHFIDIQKLGERRRNKLFRSTSETRLADPETILRAIVSIPIWLVFPGMVLLGISFFSDSFTLSYPVIWQLIYLPIGMLVLLICGLGVFEPIQITRWLSRVARFRRRKRRLKKRYSRVVQLVWATFEVGYAALPAVFGVAFFIAILWYSKSLPSGLTDISLWKGTVSGISPGGDYSNLQMSDGTAFRDGMNITGARFDDSVLSRVRFSHLTANAASFRRADLTNSTFESSLLQSASFDSAYVSQVSFEGAVLTNASFRSARGVPPLASFKGATLSGTDFSGSTAPLSVLLFAALEHARMDEDQQRAVSAWEKLNPGKGRTFDEIASLAPDSGYPDAALNGRSSGALPNERSPEEVLRRYDSQRAHKLDKSLSEFPRK